MPPVSSLDSEQTTQSREDSAQGTGFPATLVVVPAFNEAEALPRTLEGLQNLPNGFEILVVDDGSQDATAEVAEMAAKESQVPIHVVRLPLNCGIGGAVQTGYLFADRDNRFEYVVQFDADGQHPCEALSMLVQECQRRQLDLCIGSRFLNPGISHVDGGFRSTFSRRFGIRFFASLISLLAGTPVTDPTSGFRCAGPRAWRAFAKVYPDDYPEPESLFWCVRHGFRVGEVAVRMSNRTAGRSSIRLVASCYYMLKVTLAILVDRIRRSEIAN